MLYKQMQFFVVPQKGFMKVFMAFMKKFLGNTKKCENKTLRFYPSSENETLGVTDKFNLITQINVWNRHLFIWLLACIIIISKHLEPTLFFLCKVFMKQKQGFCFFYSHDISCIFTRSLYILLGSSVLISFIIAFLSDDFIRYFFITNEQILTLPISSQCSLPFPSYQFWKKWYKVTEYIRKSNNNVIVQKKLTQFTKH